VSPEVRFNEQGEKEKVMSKEIELSDSSFDSEVVKNSGPVLVDFWAPWCGPCRMLAPVIDELAKEYSGKVKICKVNTDDCPSSASTYNITGIPTVLLFKNGKEMKKLVGLQPKEELKRQLDKLL
jgi:thioredoxin 1